MIKGVMMKVVAYDRYGSPVQLKLEEMETPAPKGDELLVRIHATSVNAADWHLLRADPFLVRLSEGFSKPKRRILGMDIAGEVVDAGPEATKFKIGDRVIADLFKYGYGGLAEYKCCSEEAFALAPSNMSYEEAACLPLAGNTALRAVRNKAAVKPGQRILIHGSGGGVGTYMVQVAKIFGAHVTALCGPGNVEQSRALGADEVVDYTQRDILDGTVQFDTIFAVNGSRKLSEYSHAMTDQGLYLMVGGSNSQIFQALLYGAFYSRRGGKKFTHLAASTTVEDLETLVKLAEEGKLKTVLDKQFTLSETAEAIRYLETGHAKGKVVVLPQA
ncbi:NAD(P)-dependent alcohol dehydrogenase [bacterium]|nr:NAD(P)-dependent alcohol dehydrogenase [bacterium]